MLKNIHAVVILVALTALTGCQTVRCTAIGAETGVQQDEQNGAQDLWNAIETADAWVQKNIW